MIQEEKESTEQRAEAIESRVGSGSLDAIATRWRSGYERSSPPLSGRSTPTPRSYQSRDYLQKYHTVSQCLRMAGGLAVACDMNSHDHCLCTPQFCNVYSPILLCSPPQFIIIIITTIFYYLDYGSKVKEIMSSYLLVLVSRFYYVLCLFGL